MYNAYYGFKEAPFSIAPDPRYLYMTPQHREALAHLVYGLNSEGGCILLTGEVGTGKTTVCRCLLEQIPENAHIALVLNPRVSAIELLETICDELKIDYPLVGNTVKTYIDRINRFLIDANARNEKTVLIIDEAQNLDSSVLEQLRLLTNLETNQRKLLQIIILGQPELLDILARPEMRQLAQRITARFHLNALAPEEIKSYIAHRLAIAGQNVQLFPEATLRRLFRLSKGIPRLINILCDRALLGCYVQNLHIVDTRTLNTAAKEVFGELKNVETRMQRKTWPWFVLALCALLGIAALLFWYSRIYMNNDLHETRSGEAAVALDMKTGSEVPGTNSQASDELRASSIETLEAPAVIVETTDPADDALENFIATASDSSKADAYQALFKLWGREFDVSRQQSACSFAAQEGFGCYHRQGNLNSLKRINRPAVLHLYNADGSDAYATLSRIDQNHAVVLSADKSFTIELDLLESHWYGEYSLLWKTPPFYTRPVRPGDSGPLVQWLDQQLARLQAGGSNTIRDTYNQDMVAQIIEFQRNMGLEADGIVGPMTFIYLNSALGKSAPVLQADQPNGD